MFLKSLKALYLLLVVLLILPSSYFRTRDTCDMNLLKNKFPAYPPNVTINDDLNEDCSCNVGSQVCPVKGFYPAPPQIKVNLLTFLVELEFTSNYL